MNDNYMKTILSGVKEWTENLTDDAIDKANNALEQANKSIDKALFVVNVRRKSGSTFSADKTYDEIFQAYNEGKYNIVAVYNSLIFPLVLCSVEHGLAAFSMIWDGSYAEFLINPNNEVIRTVVPLATTDSKLPNPYPLTFTGAVSETYDGSSAKTIEIPIGADGITPTIGDNGNWYLGDIDTNKPSRGEKGDTGANGPQGPKGDTGATGANGKSAYSYAQDGGYTGTEAEFAAKLAAEGLDKALFVVNVTQNSDGTFSADKTFNEIVQAYNEGKYNIVANVNSSTQYLAHFSPSMISFFNLFENELGFLLINKRNEVFCASVALATTDSKLPNPHPLTFTGAVSETYDGSSAKTITIPSGGGGGGSGMNLSLVYENTFKSVASIKETIDALNGKENFVFNIEFTIPSDSTTTATITNADLYNGEFDFPIVYYVGYGNYSTSYPKKAAYGSFLKLGEGLWERIRLKAVSTEMFCNQYNLVTGDNIAFQYLKDNLNNHAAGLRIDFNQTMESVKIQIYAE